MSSSYYQCEPEGELQVIAKPDGLKQSHSKGFLKNQYRDAEKHKDRDPEHAQPDQPPQRIAFVFYQFDSFGIQC